MLDVEIPADQLIAAQTLSDGDATSAKSQQNMLSLANFDHAEQLFDEILQTIADELDKLTGSGSDRVAAGRSDA